MTTNMNVTIKEINEEILAAGGSAYFIGGCVRDKVLGRHCHDHDIVVVGFSGEKFMRLFPQAKKTGNSFPVFRMDAIIDGILEKSVEFALARTERKDGTGHNGFAVTFGKSVTLEEDLFRRDTTMNAVAESIGTGEIIDPFN